MAWEFATADFRRKQGLALDDGGMDDSVQLCNSAPGKGDFREGLTIEMAIGK